MRTVILQGEPGCGKTMMACMTAVHKPVHVIDIDRKINSAGWATPLIESKQLTYWELGEAYDEDTIKARMMALTGESHPTRPPQGVARFAEYFYKMPSTEEGKAAGTWVIDSATLLNYHAMAMLSYTTTHIKLQFDDWAALQKWWLSTTSYIKDVAKEHNKDLIWTVHERDYDKVGPKTTGVKYEIDSKGNRQRNLQGTHDVKIVASITGAFGSIFGMIADEYYHLYTELDGDKKPVWKCRIHPDGVRALRTSFMHKEAVHDPDFRKIWR